MLGASSGRKPKSCGGIDGDDSIPYCGHEGRTYALTRVAIESGAYPSAIIVLIQVPGEARRAAMGTDPNVNFRRTRSIYTSVIGAHTWRSDQAG